MRITTLLLICSYQSIGQELFPQKTNQFNIVVSAGVAIPVGSFSRYEESRSSLINATSKDFSIVGEPLAGTNGNIQLSYIFKSKHSVFCDFYLSSFKVKSKKYKDFLPEAALNTMGTFSNVNYTSNNWIIKSVVVGYKIFYPFQKTKLFSGIGCSIDFVTCPKANYKADYHSNYSSYISYFELSQQKETSLSPGIVITQGLEIKITKAFSLVCDLKYRYSTHSYSTIINSYDQSNSNTPRQVQEVSFDKPASVVSVNAGVSVSL